MKYSLIPKLLPVFFSALILIACSDAPKIQIKAVDCEAANITINETCTVQPQAGSQCKLSCTITIMCSGNPIGNAEIVITRKGADPEKFTTNQQGQASYAKNFPVECSTYNLEIEVQGSDKVQRKTITAKP